MSIDFEKIAEKFGTLAPVATIVFSLLPTIGAVLLDLPDGEFKKAIGPSEASESSSDATGFVPSILNVVFASNSTEGLRFSLFILLFFLAAIVAFLQFKNSPKIAWTAAKARFMTFASIALLVTSIFLAAWLFPRFHAPTRLNDLCIRMENPEVFSDRAGWLKSRESSFLGDLYSYLHGVDPRTPLSIENRRGLPTGDDFQKVHGYFAVLVTITLCSFLGLLAISLLASTAQSSNMMRPIFTSILSALLLMSVALHIMQWYYLVCDYGRLMVVSEYFQVKTNALKNDKNPDTIDQWPFDSPEMIEFDDNTIQVKNYWPVRMASSDVGIAFAFCHSNELKNCRGPQFHIIRAKELRIIGYDAGKGTTIISTGRNRIYELFGLNGNDRIILFLHDGRGTSSRIKTM